ncbi:sulfatase/phosphatase domain-containing protein [Amycolatopsis lexingtonensis]|uniref:sulfatase/phosphatase domain-containing protein n=1 Tax=Amycolatopsis lexingtonensis TaxID=218822 RepID=UPI003F723DF9
MFTSDNGYHMGEYRLTPGKQTAFDTDVHVPLVENIDLRPTFEALAGAKTPAEVDGESLVPLLNGTAPPVWRTVGLVEHHGPDFDRTDPDKPKNNSGNPSTYEATAPRIRRSCATPRRSCRRTRRSRCTTRCRR